MKIPNAERCVVDRQKIVDYLLNGSHPENGGKAEFFAALGFDADNWETLASAFRQLAVSAEVSQSVQSMHGQKFVVDGHIKSATGRAVGVRTVWILDVGSEVPRLVTGYPNG